MSPEERGLCAGCGSDQWGDPIPDSDGQYYCRTIMVEIPGIYDGGLFHQCPDCGYRWHRWPEGDWRHERAESYVAAVTS